MNLKYEKSCGAVILKDNLVLLIENKKSLHWSFPKGHKELNETDVETALREVKEETNLDITIDENKYIVINYSPYEGVTKDVVYYLAKYQNGHLKPQLEEVSNIGWYDIEDALHIITYEQERIVLIKLLNIKSD